LGITKGIKSLGSGRKRMANRIDKRRSAGTDSTFLYAFQSIWNIQFEHGWKIDNRAEM